MDAFGDNFEQSDVDPAAEFLAREKDQLAELEDELIDSAPAAATTTTVTQPISDGKTCFFFGVIYKRGAHTIEYI